MIWRKARKKPVVVEFREVEPKENLGTCASTEIISGPRMGESIKTREGTLYGYVGEDYIIRGVEGELYPIKKEIFHKTYEVIEDESSLEGCFSCGR